MRLLGKLAIGGGAVSAVTAGALIVGGVFATSATLVAVDPGAKPAQADGLAAFDDCGALLDWFVDHNLSEVGPYGWGGQVMYMKGLNGVVPEAMDLRSSSGSVADNGQGSSTTGTNTQEAAVDEPDVAKTDGKLIVRLTGPNDLDTDQMLAVSDVTGAEPRTLARLHLPHGSYDSQLLLVGKHVLVTQSVSGYGGPIAYDRMYGIGPMKSAETRVLDVDITDPAHPQIARTDVYSGSLISARQYGDTVRLVTDTGRPELKWWTPDQNKVSSNVALQHNKQVLRDSTIEDWLPSVRGSAPKSRLMDCSDVLHPKAWSGSDVIAVTTFKPGGTQDRSAVGITASGGIVYSSSDRLYVASTRWEQPRMTKERYPTMDGGGRALVPSFASTTDLHAFALEPTTTKYVASGQVDGTVRDRWSLDSYDGKLRVAWSKPSGSGVTQNGITVLGEDNGRLVHTGSIDRLGINEDIQAVRWFDDLAVLVTYRQIDPLYTVDLSDPTDPRVLGTLKIPGYSGYLHPIGHGLLLGLGMDATTTGISQGPQAAVFDIGDLTHPKRVSRIGFGIDSGLSALDDPRGFTWLPDQRIGLTAVNAWHSAPDNSGAVRLVAMKVGQNGELSSRTVASLDQGWQTRVLPLDDGRVAVVDGDRVQLVRP
jgi:hypothetical protein